MHLHHPSTAPTWSRAHCIKQLMHAADLGGEGSESFFCKTSLSAKQPSQGYASACCSSRPGVPAWPGGASGRRARAAMLLAWGQRCQPQTLPQEELAGITSSPRASALQDRLLHLASWSQQTVLRHFRAFLPHLERDDSHCGWQHYGCVLSKQAYGEQESALCMGNASSGQEGFLSEQDLPCR